jgi:outer membrane protein OmpA-like peptidoglycan-associated protein
VSATVIDHLELFAALASRSNSNDMGNPTLLQVAGDLTLGAKAYASILPWLSVGGDLRVLFLNTVGDVGVTGDSTSAGLRAAVTADLTHLPTPVPLMVRANIGYLLNNSAKLIERVESDRYAALPASNRRPELNEDRHLLTRIERFALGIDRVDLFTMGVGVEAPLALAPDFYVQPLMEWQLGLPVNRQGYDCLAVPTDAGVNGGDGCLATTGISAAPSSVVMGIRALPPVPGLSVFLGGEIGLTGTKRFVRELAPTRPWAFVFALGYAIDTRAAYTPERREPPTESVTATRAPQLARIHGVVVEHGSGLPIIGAVVRYPDHELSPQLTGAEGRFVSYAFEPGEVVFEITHPDYDPARCTAQVPELAPPPVSAAGTATAAGLTPAAPAGAADSGEPAPLRCELSARPRVSNLVGTVRDEHDKPLSGVRVEIRGPTPQTLTSSASGELMASGLAPGEYTARVDEATHLVKTQPFTVTLGSDARLALTLVDKPTVSHVVLLAHEVKITAQVVFNPNSSEIDVRSTGLLSEIADLLARNPQVEHLEVQGHTDNRGTPAHNLQLSQQRAETVVRWLEGFGIDPARLEAKGYGDERPLVPNLTTENRARNRRVQFMIVDKK